MKPQKIIHYMQRTAQLGVIKSCLLISNRLIKKYTHRSLRTKALNRICFHTWQYIAKKNNFRTEFNFFWQERKRALQLSLNNLQLTNSDHEILQDATQITNNCFSILGSAKKSFSSIPWHIDIRLAATNENNSSFNPELYYKEIEITSGTDKKNLTKDIKVPWELSRLQHFFVLGAAYQKTADSKYVTTFINQFSDWHINNSFLLGPNWVCPMDVGIRAVNLVWALALLKDSAELPEDFLQLITSSLYDHMIYLEQNWEKYDDLKTSNHYLSDLIGYLYLCYFFSDFATVTKKATWCYQELLREFEKQIFDEGTDYEGSTAYHVLITEIFYHFYLVGTKMGFVFPDSFIIKLKRMFSFIDWCKAGMHESMILIGDNDSGKLLYYGLSNALIESMKEPVVQEKKNFPEFGLSIVKNNRIHCSLRYYVYQEKQPSGHFHNDAASITVSIDKIPIFIDPGTYVYTPSAWWRNYFRSVAQHNTFYIQETEPIEFTEHLFEHMIKPVAFDHSLLAEDRLKTTHELYKERYGLEASRELQYTKSQLQITDIWWSQRAKDPQLFGVWNFTLNPAVTVKKTDEGYTFEHAGIEIVCFTSTLAFTIQEGFVSYAYGTKVPTLRLEAIVNIMHDDPVVTLIQF